jgi:hypothetical protein
LRGAGVGVRLADESDASGLSLPFLQMADCLAFSMMPILGCLSLGTPITWHCTSLSSQVSAKASRLRQKVPALLAPMPESKGPTAVARIEAKQGGNPGVPGGGGRFPSTP